MSDNLLLLENKDAFIETYSKKNISTLDIMSIWRRHGVFFKVTRERAFELAREVGIDTENWDAL